MEEKSPRKLTRGGKNLVIMGVLSTVIALTTTVVSLLIYHNSGDIYLDRSRPGFLPDEEEVQLEEFAESEYEFDKSGKITPEVLNEYLENLEGEIKIIDSFEKPFNMEVLSDERLGVPAE